MSEEQTEPDHQMELVMPFLCCQDQGGPYDATAFVSGCRFGEFQTKLRLHPIELADYVFPEMVAQYDLLAMKEGYAMKAEPWDEQPDEWVLVTFRLGGWDEEVPSE